MSSQQFSYELSGCYRIKAKMIPAAFAVRDKLSKNFIFLPAAEFAALGNILAHAKHVEATMTIATEFFEESSKK